MAKRIDRGSRVRSGCPSRLTGGTADQREGDGCSRVADERGQDRRRGPAGAHGMGRIHAARRGRERESVRRALLRVPALRRQGGGSRFESADAGGRPGGVLLLHPRRRLLRTTAAHRRDPRAARHQAALEPPQLHHVRRPDHPAVGAAPEGADAARHDQGVPEALLARWLARGGVLHHRRRDRPAGARRRYAHHRRRSDGHRGEGSRGRRRPAADRRGLHGAGRRGGHDRAQHEDGRQRGGHAERRDRAGGRAGAGEQRAGGPDA